MLRSWALMNSSNILNIVLSPLYFKAFPNFMRISYKPDFELMTSTENYTFLLFGVSEIPAEKHCLTQWNFIILSIGNWCWQYVLHSTTPPKSQISVFGEKKGWTKNNCKRYFAIIIIQHTVMVLCRAPNNEEAKQMSTKGLNPIPATRSLYTGCQFDEANYTFPVSLLVSSTQIIILVCLPAAAFIMTGCREWGLSRVKSDSVNTPI